MAKRSAAAELTDRNWDQEEEPEEVCINGHFLIHVDLWSLPWSQKIRVLGHAFEMDFCLALLAIQ